MVRFKIYKDLLKLLITVTSLFYWTKIKVDILYSLRPLWKSPKLISCHLKIENHHQVVALMVLNIQLPHS